MSSEEVMDTLMYRIQRNCGKWNARKIDALETRLQVAAALLRGARNALQPINRLPSEVLAIIFKETQYHPPNFLPLSSETPGADHSSWLGLLTVCRQWRSIGATHRSLWATIEENLSPRMFISRSAESPLTVMLGLRGKAILRKDIVMHVLEQAHRIRALHIDPWRIPPDPLPLHTCMVDPMPLLESLTLLSNERSPWPMGWPPAPVHNAPSSLPSLFSGHMPRLKTLCVEGFTSWPSTYFHNLVHLCLYRQTFQGRMSTTQFLDFLEDSPLLESLVLIDAGPTLPMSEDLPPVPVGRIVRLPKLMEVDIGVANGVQPVSRLLSHLHLSKKTRLYVWGEGASLLGIEHRLVDIIPETTHHLENFMNITEFRYVQQAPGMHAGGLQLFSVENNTVVVQGYFTSMQMAGLTKKLHLTQVTTASFGEAPYTSLNHAQAVLDMWKDTLEFLPRLETLILRSDVARNMHDPLSVLYPSTKDSSLFCPELKTIRLEGRISDVPIFFLGALASARAQVGAAISEVRIIGSAAVTPSWSSYAGDGWNSAWPNPTVPVLIFGASDEVVDRVSEQVPQYAQGLSVLRREVEEVGVWKVRHYQVKSPVSWPTAGYRWHKQNNTRRDIRTDVDPW